MPTQKQMYYAAERRCAELHEAMYEMLYGDNPITDNELVYLSEKYPHKYGRYAYYLGRRPMKT